MQCTFKHGTIVFMALCLKATARQRNSSHVMRKRTGHALKTHRDAAEARNPSYDRRDNPTMILMQLSSKAVVSQISFPFRRSPSPLEGSSRRMERNCLPCGRTVFPNKNLHARASEASLFDNCNENNACRCQNADHMKTCFISHTLHLVIKRHAYELSIFFSSGMFKPF